MGDDYIAVMWSRDDGTASKQQSVDLFASKDLSACTPLGIWPPYEQAQSSFYVDGKA